jgi:hypothetical protein
MNPYDLITLLTVLSTQKTIKPFWGRWFTSEIVFDTAEIAFDKVNVDYRRLAPFVAPNVQGRVQRRSGSSIVSYRPAYVKPKDAVRPNEAFRRTPGEALITGTLTPEQRRNATVARLLGEHRIKIDNRVEWMRAKALIDGAITVEGRDYPKVTIDFNRDASLTVTLTGTAQWDEPEVSSTADPIGDLQSLRRAINDLTGDVARDYVFGSNAWALFYGFLDPEELQNNELRGSEGTISRFLDGLEGVEYAGDLRGVGGAGLMRCWVYSQKAYEDDSTNTLTDILNTDTVVLIGEGVQGVDCYGAIEDHDALLPLKYFPKVYDEQDPSVRYLLTQSAPLPVPKQINSTASIRVA